MSARPLDGITVVSFEHAVSVPYATRLLADLGADVIKVERPGGDFARAYDTACGEVSSYFAWINRGKRSVVLDLKDPGGLAAAQQLADRADVVLANLGPGATARLGLDGDTLRARRPELITCELTGYGDGGPSSGRKAYDALIQSEAGLLELTGDGAVTARAGISVADIAAGVQVHSAVLAALLHRQRTGAGATLRISLLEALAEWMHQPMLYALGTGAPPARTGGHHPSIAPYGPFTCGDGAAVHLAVQNEREWARLCAVVLDDPGLATDPRFATVAGRVRNRPELHAELHRRFGVLTAAELGVLLDEADIAWSSVGHVAELPEHPQLVARNRWRPVPVPGGADIPMLVPPVDSSAWGAPREHAVPALGAHTGEVLAELGCSPDEIATLTRHIVPRPVRVMEP
ncbi:CaiB/BaiF CoA transferase family protein [Pseudonocardia asaccharolytica]|uniref:Dehydratase n=1 Tax=Pseudonocardia asaccharolytica DSM 44247 = NBRC 16224 TaxID=1123024 RepID=A0A511CZV1_9PSEU|nr:CaiB/BaiF CoA-transferase family protein [Pseudonocardia asaccharolytica]GEL16804.1 dehydratase [Pseudonocardia asaccharolytica DSM 44247 = NBRC 16224]